MNPYLDIDRAMLGDIYTSTEPLDNLTVLCDDFGSRTPGTPQERSAAEFMRDRLASYGLDARLEPFEYRAWERDEVSISVKAPFEADIPGISLPYCPPCDLTAPLVLLPDGAPATFEANADRIKGAVVAVSSAPPAGLGRTVHRTEMYQRSALAGAVGFIFIGMYEGRGVETGSLDSDREALIPGFSVGHEDAEFLRRQEGRKGALTITMRTGGRTFDTTSWNVVADMPGETEEFVLLGCHYDGHDIAQGAMDPASGTVAAIEAARVLKAHAGPMRCGLRVILWGSEEIGLTGAHRDVTQNGDLLTRMRFLLNCDAAGGHGEKGVILNQWPGLEPLFDEWSEQMGDLPYGQSAHAFSDHYPYLVEGLCTSYIGNPRGKFTGRGWGHTRYDTLDKIDIRNLHSASALAARVTLRAANAETWPVATRPRADVEAMMDDEPDLRDMRVVKREYAELYTARGKSPVTG
ncbi:M28 family peptidase [Candidatus Poribacteria bacterium]|jgi:hypothetical protein|nr:M28 family peptidase [Candidatus Poribacteria bacterium]MBT5714075.1 M28 family peptidase [Candidatus Poribacteria bacterium]MBT7808327.1 M28 family peptidase [Candidatus Poribacteria bacterium]